MPKRHKTDDASQRYHNRVARQYDAIYDDDYWQFHDELTWRTVKPHLPQDLSARCADLGCGTGKWGMRLLKSGFATSFVDHSGAMIAQAREKIQALGPKASRADFHVADIMDMHDLPSDQYTLILAMGDPLSICAEPQRAANDIFRIARPGGIFIGTADSQLAALDHFVERGNLDALEKFLDSSKTHWLTRDSAEQFSTTTFTPATLTKLFERSGFEVLRVIGKPVIPVRQNKMLLTHPNAQQRLLRLEADLQKDPTTAAHAAHLQITARKPIQKSD